MLKAKEKKSNFGRKAMRMGHRDVMIWAVLVILLTTGLGYADLTDGLVGYWSFDDPGSLGHDDSGTGNNGYPVGGVTSTSGVLDGAMHLDGSGYINVPDSPSLDLPRARGTISAFIKVDPSSDQCGIVVKESSSSSFASTIAYQFSLRSDYLSLLTSDGSSTGWVSYYPASLADSAWHHVSATWVPDDIRLYVDGVLVSQGNLGNPIYEINNISHPVLIGAFRWNTWGQYRYMTGDMDEVRIYNRALSEDEIRELAFGASKVDVDIKPGSCPNPLNVKSNGLLPVAVLGSKHFDVFNIDPASIRLESVAPIRSNYEDVAKPVSNKTDDCDCTTEGPDGYLDLVLKFDAQEIVAALCGVYDGDVYLLTLTGEALDGTPIEGTDCVVIIAKGGKCEMDLRLYD